MNQMYSTEQSALILYCKCVVSHVLYIML